MSSPVREINMYLTDESNAYYWKNDLKSRMPDYAFLGENQIVFFGKLNRSQFPKGEAYICFENNVSMYRANVSFEFVSFRHRNPVSTLAFAEIEEVSPERPFAVPGEYQKPSGQDKTSDSKDNEPNWFTSFFNMKKSDDNNDINKLFDEQPKHQKDTQDPNPAQLDPVVERNPLDQSSETLKESKGEKYTETFDYGDGLPLKK